MNMNVIKVLQEHDEIKELNLNLKEFKRPNNVVDLIIKINKEKVFVEEKYEVRPSQVNPIFKQSKLFPNEIFLLAAKYITPKAKELLRKHKINYIDAGGNMMLRLSKTLIFVDGKPVKSPSEQYKNRAFTKVGAKLIFTLLKNPKYVNLNYRALAVMSTCSLGSISKIIDHLKEEKFIVTLVNDKMKIVREEKLLDKWIEALSMHLLPAMLIGKYNFMKNSNWQELNLTKSYKWGGEAAASILTKNLRPETFSIYTNKKSNEIIKDLKIVPNDKGEISIYKEFWNDGMKNNMVHPVLVYAELIASNDSRNLEIAEEIKEKYLNEDL